MCYVGEIRVDIWFLIQPETRKKICILLFLIFALCLLAGGQVCLPRQEWKPCVRGAVSCADLTMNLSRNCTPGCQCPHGTVQQVGRMTLHKQTHIYSNRTIVIHAHSCFQDGKCVQESDCRCDVNGERYEPGDTVPTGCNNW